MSGLERKKLLCAMLFHIIAMTCVCWSLYVLIDRTLDEVQKGHLEWPFWTKLIVVGIGFMGGIVFMYIQCKAYFVLCKRWKAYNRYENKYFFHTSWDLVMVLKNFFSDSQQIFSNSYIPYLKRFFYGNTLPWEISKSKLVYCFNSLNLC